MKCPNCGADADGSANFCRLCGTAVSPQTVKCPGCGADAGGGASFCASCGARILTAPPQSPSPPGGFPPRPNGGRRQNAGAYRNGADIYPPKRAFAKGTAALACGVISLSCFVFNLIFNVVTVCYGYNVFAVAHITVDMYILLCSNIVLGIFAVKYGVSSYEKLSARGAPASKSAAGIVTGVTGLALGFISLITWLIVLLLAFFT